jgi:phosphatidate cytidylyltransferase
MLRWRLIFGAIFIASFVGLCWLDYRASVPGIVLLPVALMLAVLACGELLAMFRLRGHNPSPWNCYGGVCIVVLAAAVPGFLPTDWLTNAPLGRLGWLAIGLQTALLIVVVGEMWRFSAPGQAIVNLALAAFASLYVGGLVGFLVQLRILGGEPWGNDGRWGMLALLSLVATVKMSDTGQYAIGRLFGRRKLAPVISPSKTWEGAVGGVIFALFTAWIVFHWGTQWLVGSTAATTSVGAILLFGAAVAVAGMLGDLAESLLKRDARVKDSSTWLPGLGGVLDLLDSILGAAPIAYTLWALRIVGPQ